MSKSDKFFFGLYIAAAIVIALAAWSMPARAALLVDLSKHLVAITAGFTGTDVLLFGAAEEAGERP